MSTKRQPSKQRRQTQNRAQRAAREARKQNADAASVPAGKVGTPAAPAPKGSVLSRLTGTSRGATSGAAGGTARATGVGTAKAQPTGYRAALTAVLMAGVGTIFALTLKAPVDQQGEIFRTREDKTADWAGAALTEALAQPDLSAQDLASEIDWQPGGSESYVTAGFPLSLAVVLPLGAAGLAFWSVRKGSTSRVVNRCMYISLFGALLTQSLAIMFLPAAIAIGVAGFQIKKEEVANAQAAAAGDDPGDDGPADDHVIEVDEVQVVDADDEPVEGDVVEAEVVEDAVVEPGTDEPGTDEPVEPPTRPRPTTRAAGGLQLTNRGDEPDEA